MKTLSQNEVTGAELAAILGDCTAPTISRLTKAGIFTRNKAGKYDKTESVQAYIRHKEARLHEGKSLDPIMGPLRAEKLQVQIDLLKHTLAVETGKYHLRDDCCQSLIALYSEQSHVLHRLGSVIAEKRPEVAGLRAVVDVEVDAIIARLRSCGTGQVRFSCPHCNQIVEKLNAIEPEAT